MGNRPYIHLDKLVPTDLRHGWCVPRPAEEWAPGLAKHQLASIHGRHFRLALRLDEDLHTRGDLHDVPDVFLEAVTEGIEYLCERSIPISLTEIRSDSTLSKARNQAHLKKALDRLIHDTRRSSKEFLERLFLAYGRNGYFDVNQPAAGWGSISDEIFPLEKAIYHQNSPGITAMVALGADLSKAPLRDFSQDFNGRTEMIARAGDTESLVDFFLDGRVDRHTVQASIRARRAEIMSKAIDSLRTAAPSSIVEHSTPAKDLVPAARRRML